MPLEIGVILNQRYRIDLLLGQGGFGAVYRAWDQNLGKAVALKENLETSPDAQRQFEREALMLANLSHPNLPRVTDYFFIADQGQYLVMDFVEGKDLQAILEEREGKLPEQQVLYWIGQVCDALAYLHAQVPPIIHRDIKPSNIKVNPAGQAVLVDFGIAKKYDPRQKTTIGARAVTPGYSPIEQYGQGATDERTDLYALGATLYHLLTGLTPPESIQRMIRDTLVPVQQANPQVSPGTAAAVERALQIDPARRFQSALEFKQALFSAASQPVVQPQAAVSRQPAAAAPAASVPRTAVVSEPFPGGSGAPPSPVAVQPTTAYPATARPAAPRKTSPWVWVAGIGGVGLLGLIGVIVVIALLLRAINPGSGAEATNTSVAAGALSTATLTASAPTASPSPALPSPTPRFRSSDPSTLVLATNSEPETLDPALDYESTGGGILSNIYETLITYDREAVDRFIPQLASSWEVSSDGTVYTFHIRPGVRFHDGSELTVEDVAYSLQRAILQGGSASPQWLMTEPLFGVGIYDITQLVDSSGNLLDEPAKLAGASSAQRLAACQRVLDAIQADPATNSVRIKMTKPWAPFLATLAGPWAAIQSKAWMQSNGAWDGNCANWHLYYGKTSTELNKTALGSQANGTGPYRLDHWTIGQEIVLKANPYYWRTDPAWPGAPVGEARIKTVVIKYIEDYNQRLQMIKDGQADMVDGVSWNELDTLVGEICQQDDQHCSPTASPDAALEVVRGLQAPSRGDFFFNLKISTSGGNSYLGSGRLDGKGIPANFFEDVHIRRAFSYCFNYENYLRQALSGEGVRSINVIPPGLLGDDPTAEGYTYDLNRCRQEFEAATIGDVISLGFKFQLPYRNTSLRDETFAKILQEELAKVNSKFIVEPLALDSQKYSSERAALKLPIEYHAWIQDIPDPHNWAVPWTVGTFGSRQGMSQDLIGQFQAIIDRGVMELDSARRATVYAEFNRLYHEQALAILTYMSVDRHYQQRWVNGWYYQPALFGSYFYALWKD